MVKTPADIITDGVADVMRQHQRNMVQDLRDALPPLIATAFGMTIPPVAAATSDNKRRPGRPKGSKNKPKDQPISRIEETDDEDQSITEDSVEDEEAPPSLEAAAESSDDESEDDSEDLDDSEGLTLEQAIENLAVKKFLGE